MLKEGTKAPDFALCDKDGKTVTLQDFAGKKLVLYFYPKDNTAGCTKQACAFAAVYEGSFFGFSGFGALGVLDVVSFAGADSVVLLIVIFGFLSSPLEIGALVSVFG